MTLTRGPQRAPLAGRMVRCCHTSSAQRTIKTRSLPTMDTMEGEARSQCNAANLSVRLHTRLWRQANCLVSDARTSVPDALTNTNTLTDLKSTSHIGYPNIDINGPRQDGFAIPQATIRRGARCSSAKAFLGDARGRSNLHVIVFAYVTQILFNQNKEAIGVMFDRFNIRHKVFAKREVIVCAGAVNSPQLLMLSG